MTISKLYDEHEAKKLGFFEDEEDREPSEEDRREIMAEMKYRSMIDNQE